MTHSPASPGGRLDGRALTLEYRHPTRECRYGIRSRDASGDHARGHRNFQYVKGMVVSMWSSAADTCGPYSDWSHWPVFFDHVQPRLV